MVFPTAVQDETLVPQFGAGMWGDVRSWLSCLINIIVCFSFLFFFSLPYPRLRDRPAPQPIGLWCRGTSQQPDSSVQGRRGCSKSFPSQRAAQSRLFFEALWCRDFALSSTSLKEFVFTSDLFMVFYYPLSFMHDLNQSGSLTFNVAAYVQFQIQYRIQEELILEKLD